MSWTLLRVSLDRTHHERDDVPAYTARFDEVLKFHAPGLAPVRRGAQAWHITSDGIPAYARRFQRTFGYYEGLAAVVSESGWHHIDAAGADAYAQRYAWCGNFQGSRCSVRELDGRYLHIGGDGWPIYAQRWRYAGDYRDGVAVVQADDGSSTHIDLQGRQLHGRWFLDLDVFHKGFARARDNEGWTHVDRDGEPAYTRRFAAVEPFYNGQARVERFDGALEVIDEAGARVLELRPPTRSEFAALSEDMVGFWRTRTIAVAVDLGAFEALPCSTSELAKRCALGTGGARRMLRALGELRLVVGDDFEWRPTTRGALLRSSHPWTLADAALEYGGPLARMWDRLPSALRDDGDGSTPDVFAEVARDSRRRNGHHRMLRSYARHDYPRVIEALDLRGDEHVVDAGGGLGVLGRLLLDAHPGAQVTVLERPEVVEQGRREPDEPAGLHWQAGDLFTPWQLEADAVLLARVLHDWDDEAATRILARAREVLPRGGRVFVVEMLLDDGGVAGSLCDLHLLAVAGGRERSAQAYGRLFETAGFTLEDIRACAALPSVVVGIAR